LASSPQPSLYIVSLRNYFREASQGCVVELEEVVAELTDAMLISPSGPQELAAKLDSLPTAHADLFFAAISLSNIVGLLKETKGWHRPFLRVFCYIFDSWVPEAEAARSGFRHSISSFTRTVRQIDHLFVSNPRAIEAFSDVYKISVSCMAMAADVKQFGSMQPDRAITVNAYGRQNVAHADVLAKSYNTTRSSRSLYHTNHMASGGILDLQQHRAFFWKMLSMSCITLAYDPVKVDPGHRRFPFSFVAQRWFEGLAAGCVVVGYRPDCPEADQLLNWTDATLECPTDPKEFLQFIDDLASDLPRLKRIRVSNFNHMLQAHDWGYRVVEMMAVMSIEPQGRWPRRHAELLKMRSPE